VVSYGGKTIPRWRTVAILKIVISPYLSEKSSDFDEILYIAADFELDERHVIKNEKKLHWTDSEFDRTYFLFSKKYVQILIRPPARLVARPQLLSTEPDRRHTAGVVNCCKQSATVGTC